MDYVLVSQCYCEAAESLRLWKVSESCQTSDAELDIIAQCVWFYVARGFDWFVSKFPKVLVVDYVGWSILWVVIFQDFSFFLWKFLGYFPHVCRFRILGFMIFCSRSETVAVWLSEDSILQSRALYFFSFLAPTISLRRVQRLTCWLYGLLLNNSIKILIMG